MQNRINVLVDGKVVGTVLAFPNFTGAEAKAQLEGGHGSAIRVILLYGDVAHIEAATFDAARALPSFSAATA